MYLRAAVLGLFLMTGNLSILGAQESPIEKFMEANCMPSTQNIKIVSKLLNGGLSEDSIEAYDEILAQDIVVHGPAMGQEIAGIEICQEIDRSLRKGFRDIHVKTDEIFAGHDKVVVYWTVSGISAQGENENKNIVVSGHGIYRIKEAKICEIWQTWDKMIVLE